MWKVSRNTVIFQYLNNLLSILLQKKWSRMHCYYLFKVLLVAILTFQSTYLFVRLLWHAEDNILQNENVWMFIISECSGSCHLQNFLFQFWGDSWSFDKHKFPLNQLQQPVCRGLLCLKWEFNNEMSRWLSFAWKYVSQCWH